MALGRAAVRVVETAARARLRPRRAVRVRGEWTSALAVRRATSSAQREPVAVACAFASSAGAAYPAKKFCGTTSAVGVTMRVMINNPYRVRISYSCTTARGLMRKYARTRPSLRRYNKTVRYANRLWDCHFPSDKSGNSCSVAPAQRSARGTARRGLTPTRQAEQPHGHRHGGSRRRSPRRPKTRTARPDVVGAGRSSAREEARFGSLAVLQMAITVCGTWFAVVVPEGSSCEPRVDVAVVVARDRSCSWRPGLPSGRSARSWPRRRR